MQDWRLWITTVLFRLGLNNFFLHRHQKRSESNREKVSWCRCWGLSHRSRKTPLHHGFSFSVLSQPPLISLYVVKIFRKSDVCFNVYEKHLCHLQFSFPCLNTCSINSPEMNINTEHHGGEAGVNYTELWLHIRCFSVKSSKNVIFFFQEVLASCHPLFGPSRFCKSGHSTATPSVRPLTFSVFCCCSSFISLQIYRSDNKQRTSVSSNTSSSNSLESR